MAYIDSDGTVQRVQFLDGMSGSGLIASVRTTYAALVDTFGQVDCVEDSGAPSVYGGWIIRTPHGTVSVYDFAADVREGYRHDEHPADVLRYSVGGYRENAAQAFACVVAALVKAGHPVEIAD